MIEAYELLLSVWDWLVAIAGNVVPAAAAATAATAAGRKLGRQYVTCGSRNVASPLIACHIRIDRWW